MTILFQSITKVKENYERSESYERITIPNIKKTVDSHFISNFNNGIKNFNIVILNLFAFL